MGNLQNSCWKGSLKSLIMSSFPNRGAHDIPETWEWIWLISLKVKTTKRITTTKTMKQVKALALLQSQSQDAKAKSHQGLTQKQQALQLLFVLQYENRQVTSLKLSYLETQWKHINNPLFCSFITNLKPINQMQTTRIINPVHFFLLCLVYCTQFRT